MCEATSNGQPNRREVTAADLSWRVAGRPNGEPPVVGREYTIHHSRKGTFTGRILKLWDCWADVEITRGFASAAMAYNVREVGDTVTIRDSQCVFAPQIGGVA